MIYSEGGESVAKAGRPKAEFDKRAFEDLIGFGCKQDEICWFFRDESGKPANKDTLSRWCKRTYGMNFQEYAEQNGAEELKIQLRRNQLRLSETNAAMAIWLGKQYLGQKDPEQTLKELRFEHEKEMDKKRYW